MYQNEIGLDTAHGDDFHPVARGLRRILDISGQIPREAARAERRKVTAVQDFETRTCYLT